MLSATALQYLTTFPSPIQPLLVPRIQRPAETSILERYDSFLPELLCYATHYPEEMTRSSVSFASC